MVFIRLCKLNEELGGARNERFCTQANNDKSTKELEDLSEILSLRQIVLTNEIQLFYNGL